MLGPAKYGVIIIGIALIAYMLSPLAALFFEIYRNPNALGLTIKPLEYFENQSALMEITYMHNITIPFKNLTIEIFGSKVNFGDVSEGVYSKNLTVPLSAIQNESKIKASFILAGIYPVTIEVEGK